MLLNEESVNNNSKKPSTEEVKDDKNSIVERFQRFFGSHKTNSLNEQNQTKDEISHSTQIPSQISGFGDFAWIENEALLRDEGVLFGIAGGKNEEKINAIKEYYSRKIEVSKSKIDQEQEEITRLEIELHKIDEEIKDLVQKSSGTKSSNGNFKPTSFIRNLLSLTFIFLGGAGSFMIISHYLKDNYQYGQAAAAGVFFFGLFAQFRPLSDWIRHDKEENREKWQVIKTTLLEVGTTLSATILVGYHVYEQDELIVKALVVSFFIFFLFLFCGRLILGFINNLNSDIKEIKSARKIRNEMKREAQKIDDQLNNLKVKKQELQKEIKLSNDSIRNEQGKIMENLGLSKTKVEIFLSEYKLAESFKDTVSSESK